MTFAAAASPPPTTVHPNIHPVRGVCLDVDDTLVDYTGSAKRALAAMLGARSGIDAAWEIWQQITDEHALAVVHGRLAYSEMHTIRTRAFFSAIGEEIGGAEAARRERARAAAMRAGWVLFDDARECLGRLRRAGLRLAAVTNASGAHQRGKLAGLGLGGMFDTVVIAGEIGAAKPDPVIFHTACARLGCPPMAVAHVGDKLDADAMGATRAGLYGVWLDRPGYGTGYAAPDGVSVIGSLRALPELLVRAPQQARQRVA